MATTAGGLVKRSTSYDPDVLAWLQARANHEERSVDWIVRRLLRDAMIAAEAWRR